MVCGNLSKTQRVNPVPLAWTSFVRAFVALIGILAVVVSSAAPAQSGSGTVPGEALFVVSGRGWGHGVGMSQWGAYGQSLADRTYDEILAHYYTGTELGQAKRSRVRVLLAEGRRAVTITSEAPFSVVDGTGAVHRVAQGPLTLRADLALPGEGGSVPATPPLVVRPGKQPLALDGHVYRGKLQITVQSSFVRVVNVVPLVAYLQAVVPSEMPHTWPLEALKAQAVAARSYALANLVKGKPFDLYADVRSQVYSGVSGEKPRATQAVRETAGQVLYFDGKIATTYYFSSSGGKTASAEDVLGFPVPYLLSRPDPWDKASPHHRWGPVLIGARTLQSRLGLEDRVLDAVGVRTPSGRLRALTLETAGDSTSVPASLLRSSLGLRSTWATVGVLRLDRPRVSVRFGSTLRLSGLARDVAAPTVAASKDGATWSTLGPLANDEDGVGSVTVKPQATARYRIQAKEAASPAVLVRVAPRVRLLPRSDAATLVGVVRPRLDGAPVTVERREAGIWISVAETRVDATGAFSVDLAGIPGTYRARVAPTGGYAEGVAVPIKVTG